MNTKKVCLRLTEEARAGVRAQAERLGILNTRGEGKYHGQGSVTGLVRAIGLGELKVIRAEKTE